MKLPGYKIKAQIGKGGMALVYRATNNISGEEVAIKVLLQHLIDDKIICKRFLAEAEIMMSMRHKNVIRVLESIENNGVYAFVMEYVDGCTLKKYIEQKSPLSESEVKSLFRQMLSAVGYVHKKGFIHRDITPSNFLVTDGKIKLLDFGIAKNMERSYFETVMTGTSQWIGTPLYMSPEQFKSTKDVTIRTDIYSLGVVLWQMLTGQYPYNADGLLLYELQEKIFSEKLSLTRTVFDKVISVATSKEPRKRYGSCAKFLSAFVEVKNLDNKSNKGTKVVREKKVNKGSKINKKHPVTPINLDKKLFDIRQNKILKYKHKFKNYQSICIWENNYLRKVCHDLGLPTNGIKKELASRIANTLKIEIVDFELLPPSAPPRNEPNPGGEQGSSEPIHRKPPYLIVLIVIAFILVAIFIYTKFW